MSWQNNLRHLSGSADWFAEGSLRRHDNNLFITFGVTDDKNTIPVTYKGILPDLFREGQGVVAEGIWKDGIFQATHLLAKHDENICRVRWQKL